MRKKRQARHAMSRSRDLSFRVAGWRNAQGLVDWPGPFGHNLSRLIRDRGQRKPQMRGITTMTVEFLESKPNDGFNPKETPFPSLVVGEGKRKTIYLKVDSVFSGEQLPQRLKSTNDAVATARFTGKTNLVTLHEIEVVGHRKGITILTADYGNGFDDVPLTIHVFHSHS